jgi:ABC-2 type transport system permease protein
MHTETQNSTTHTTQKRAGTLHITWLIARRQIGEALRDRSTLIMSGFFLAFQTVLVLLSVGPALGDHTQKGLSNAGVLMAFFLLFVGLLPATPAVGIASGAFAGDKERGSLMPLLVTPASNTAIVAGKVLGAILPALAYAAIGILVYFAEIALLYGPDKLALFPIGFSGLIVLLIPAIVLFGTALASVISSRVRTFQSAQNYSSLILVVLWLGLGALFFLVGIGGLWAFAGAVIGVYVVAVLLIVLSAATWRREEVMARQ